MMCKVTKRKRVRKRTGETIEFYTVRFRDQHGIIHEIAAGPKKKFADALAEKIRLEVLAGTFSMKPKKEPDLLSHCERFVESKKLGRKDSTWQDYDSVIRNHLAPFFEQMPLADITPSLVEDFLQYLAKEGVSDAMIAKSMRVLRLVLRDAVRKELIDRDPSATITAPSVERKEMFFLTPKEVKRLIKAGEPIIKPILMVACFTGMRLGEILALRWRKVDFDKEQIYVVSSWRRGQGFTPPKSKSSVRFVPICAELRRSLLAHYKNMGRPPDDELVFFPNVLGDRHNPLRRGYDKALDKSKITKVRFHDLRHTAAALFIEAGVDILTVQTIMGHSSAAITLDLYGHLYSSSFDRARKGMDRLMSGSDNVIRLPLRKDESAAQADEGS